MRLAVATNNPGKLAEIACAEGQVARAADLGQRALALVRTAGRAQNEADILNALGRIAVRSGQPRSAVAHHRQRPHAGRNDATT